MSSGASAAGGPTDSQPSPRVTAVELDKAAVRAVVGRILALAGPNTGLRAQAREELASWDFVSPSPLLSMLQTVLGAAEGGDGMFPLWISLTKAFTPGSPSEGEIRARARTMQFMARAQRLRSNAGGAAGAGAQMAARSPCQPTRVNHKGPPLELPAISGVAASEVRTSFCSFCSGAGALVRGGTCGVSLTLAARSLAQKHAIGAAAVAMLGPRKTEFYTLAIDGISNALGDENLAVDAAARGAFERLVSCGIVSWAARRLAAINSSLGTEGLPDYPSDELWLLLALLLNVACSPKPEAVSAASETAGKEFTATAAHQWFLQEAHSPDTRVRSLVKAALSAFESIPVSDDGKRLYGRGPKLKQLLGGTEPDLHPYLRRRCSHCRVVEEKAKAYRRCSACRRVAYCSRECQKNHWKAHKAACRAVKKCFQKKSDATAR